MLDTIGRFPAAARAAARAFAATISVRVSDQDPGWGALSGRDYERTQSEIQELYTDALEAWRKNPMAKRTVDIVNDFVIGDGISMASPFRPLQRFIDAFWHHRKNFIDNRLEPILSELTVAGDVFPVLFLNRMDGLSYIRFIVKADVLKIQTQANDWETETEYHERPRNPGDPPRVWFTPDHPQADDVDAVALHYAVNRPLGTLMGEPDLATLIPWLLRYSRMLEDRVRLNAFVRAFLWIVTVPTNRVESKREQYEHAPDSGSVIVKDEGETWEAVTPNLRGNDASHDLESVRRMIYAGTGSPPHWFGERGSNLAEATAMQNPAERHLKRRQQYFVFLLSDVVWYGYQRARLAVPSLPDLPSQSYDKLFAPAVPDVSRTDNQALAEAASKLTDVWKALVLEEEPKSRTLLETLLTHTFRFMGEPQDAQKVKKMADEMIAAAARAERQARTMPTPQPQPAAPSNGRN